MTPSSALGPSSPSLDHTSSFGKSLGPSPHLHGPSSSSMASLGQMAGATEAVHSDEVLILDREDLGHQSPVAAFEPAPTAFEPAPTYVGIREDKNWPRLREALKWDYIRWFHIKDHKALITKDYPETLNNHGALREEVRRARTVVCDRTKNYKSRSLRLAKVRATLYESIIQPYKLTLIVSRNEFRY
ncbi:uncharacterized protein N7515_001296 [Penicillium bovifimosum]|uniref:Uncharacterized protein n=1 Tax=Penicillium bovifimosum TaxID=126998 RepID=A0A9W9H9F5_9EURO|nr:uncharacterized protein N7515_001296 [Penicillium bovifimosum]KAJ5142509.1 hypothetical protein N7515_001296 [Penicillium bovifimosum]